MSAPPFVPLVPPLPPGWTQHSAPGGQPYYYNAQTKESSYVRPIPPFPVMPMLQSEPVKKEKPLVKTSIPATDWLRVRTTQGNIFYSHKTTKKSVWMVPEEIKEAVSTLERQDRLNAENASTTDATSTTQPERHAEVQTVIDEAHTDVKRKAEDDLQSEDINLTNKKAKVEEAGESDIESESSESEEEGWQKEAAAQLAEEARKREESIRLQEEAEEKSAVQPTIPDRVNLSIDEAKALFKTLLKEKDINPLHPWDTSLPKFVSDPRYVLLPFVSARREAFDEYCRDRTRELRQSVVKMDKHVNPKDEFDRLLQEQVKSTRTSWTEFRRTWKKDRIFYGWGRDDREREKRFRDHLKELGERKRLAAERAEKDFFSLLKERGNVEKDSHWKDTKRKLYDDPRYDAVGSSTLREELFNIYLKGNQPIKVVQNEHKGVDAQAADSQLDQADDKDEMERLGKKEKAVKQREQMVRKEMERVTADVGRSRNVFGREEGEREFTNMLTDAVRDPQATWSAVLPNIKGDPRFRSSPLTYNQQLQLFHSHVERIRSKHVEVLHQLFETHAPTLAVVFEELSPSSLLLSSPVVNLGYDTKRLQQDFDQWQRERTQRCRKAFDDMLAENAFVEFWGRLRKIGGEGVDGGVKADERGEDEGEGGGGKIDMKVLAKNINVADMEKVLKNDKRYIMFDHMPEQRERWIKDYLMNLSAPKLSVHVPQT